MRLRITVALLGAACLIPAASAQSTDWPTYGGDLAGTRYSPLKQINRDNVTNLQRAWTYHMRVENRTPEQPQREGNEVPPPSATAPQPPATAQQPPTTAQQPPTTAPQPPATAPQPPATAQQPPDQQQAEQAPQRPQRPGQGRPGRGGRAGFAFRRASEVTPLVVNDVMYITTSYGRIAALEPETGKEIWVYDLGPLGTPSTRGLEYWAGDKQSPPTLFFGTSQGKLVAIDAKLGKPVEGFGVHGVVDMKPGALDGLEDGFFDLSSPPIVYKNVVITGAHVQEFPSVGPYGDTRAWDVHTGKLVWTFHSIPRPGEKGSETWSGTQWQHRSGTNVWGLFTIDAERGILYMPFGEPTSDYWGADRKGMNLYGTALVAVDALTGKLKWYFQGVHHDTWDYDFSAPPILFDVKKNGKKIPAVAELSKTGAFYAFNRVTGEPIWGMKEVPVPTDDELPGDEAWPTQPVPLKPPMLARTSFKREEIATITPELQKFCTDLFDSIPGGLHAGGPFAHYSTTPSVIFPSSIGGGNWNPPSYDPNLGYVFVNTQDFGSLNVMEKNEDGSYSRGSYKGINRWWNPTDRLPCNQPPWGRLFAINVNTGDIAWESTLGITDSLPEGKQNTGRPNIGGSIATAGGLVFIGATDDSRFRAFDSKTGKELWVTKLDAGAHSSPMTFMGKNGKQYIVITGNGGGFLGDPSNADSIIAFALP